MSRTILKADNICYTYDGEHTPALDHLSLDIKTGRKIACMGSNGSGKSTFFLCCNGIRRPDTGTLFYRGKPFDYSKKGLLNLRRKVGIVFQEPDHQIFCADVQQEISFGVMNLGCTEAEARRKVTQVMDKLEITPFAHKPTHALSGGQKKQVAIADILVMEPELIILDEPAAALDPLHTQVVHSLIDQMLLTDTTVMLATHDVEYAYAWADDILLFHKGRILAQGTPEEIFMRTDLLQTVNLKQPAVLSLFLQLTQDNILPPNLPFPKTMEDLAVYLKRLKSKHP